MPEPSIDARIAAARARLAANLGELQQRVTHAREMVTPATYLGSPWLKLGAIAALGLLVSDARRPRLLTSGNPPARTQAPRMLGAVVRFAVTALAGALVDRMLRDR